MKYYRWLAGACLVAIALHVGLLWMPLGLLGTVAVADVPLMLVLLFGGLPLVLSILRQMVRGEFGADMLVVLSFGTGVWMGEYLAATLIVLMLAGGQALEVYAMRTASSVLRALAERMPATAHRKQGDQLTDIALAEIAIGDAIVVFPHEAAPVDGTVIEGHGSMDESYLTGEPYRMSKVPGAAVLSGAINGDAVLVIRADKLAQDSRYAQIMTVMQDAEQKRPNIRRVGDQLGAWFAPLALIFALGTWWATGDAVRFLAVLVVATPCPLLIAIPITVISAISMAARRGIIIKNPTVLEQLPRCRTAIFDKTGTLTYGQPELTDILPAEGVNANDILQATATLERYSKHPLAGAIVAAAERAKLAVIEATQVSEAPGQGLTGTVRGKVFQITHRTKLLQRMPELIDVLPPTAPGMECVIVRDGAFAATLRFRDMPRRDGKSFVGHLAPAHQFTKVMLVSGDRASEVQYLADLLDIPEMLASQSPEQKLAIVRAETARAPTLFMGDGINDAPALAAATVGVAFGQHSAVTAEAAGAVIMESSLIKVDELIHISIAMRRIVLQSAVGGMVLSLLAMGCAAAGWISPVTGALLQEVIDVVAIANALRLSWSRTIATDVDRKYVAKSQ